MRIKTVVNSVRTLFQNVSPQGTSVAIKEVGQTPLERLELFRKEKGIAATVPLAYAGRLDPMARGKLLVLIGDACKRLRTYTGLDKEYIVDVLFGAGTDTGDLLGLVTNVSMHASNDLPAERIERALCSMLGSHQWEYPIFSSKTVQGKPLFQWFYEGKISEITIPKTDTHIYDVSVLNMRTIASVELMRHIGQTIARISPVIEESKKLGADFRRVPILERWNEMLSSEPAKDFTIARIRVLCSSGSYMRTLAEKLGEEVGIPACAFLIDRTKLGKYHRFGPFSFWFPSF